MRKLWKLPAFLQTAHDVDLSQQTCLVLVPQKGCRPRDVEMLHQIDGVALADCAQRRQVPAKVKGQFIGTRLAQQTGVGAEARA